MAARVLATPRPRSVWPWNPKLAPGKSRCRPLEYLRHFFRTGAAVGVAHHDAAHVLAHALFGELLKVVEAALGKLVAAGIAVFAAAALRVHGVLEIDDHLKAVRLQVVDGLPRHAQIFFRAHAERALDIEQPRLDHDDRNGNAPLVAQDELHIGPIFNLGAASARAPEEGQLHRAGIDIGESAGQVADKVVGAGESDLGIVHAESRHALQQEHGIGHRDLQIRLLHAVAETGVEDLDFSDGLFRHLFLQSVASPQVFLPLGQKTLTLPSYRG